MDCYLASYDIPDHKRRLKVANLLEDYGQRVQLSVFEIWLDTQAQDELLEKLKAVISAEDDSVRLYRLCAVCQSKVITLGHGQPPQAPGLLII